MEKIEVADLAYMEQFAKICSNILNDKKIQKLVKKHKNLGMSVGDKDCEITVSLQVRYNKKK